MPSPDRLDSQGTRLLRLARASIEHGLLQGVPLPVNLAEFPAPFSSPRASFTTLRLDGELRGCCGTLEATDPLAIDVARSSFRAGFRDPRFAPLGEREIDVVRLEVSVLSPLEGLDVADEIDLLDQLAPGTDGLVIAEGGRRATFLPKVWESLPDPRQFVAALKAKCGLPADYWSERLEFLRYGTTTCAEPD